jgi:Domain of unknown function (DUF5666)
MKHSIFTHSLGALARSSALLATLVAALTITACGGGGGGSDSSGANPSTPVATADDSLSNGSITGFGSVIVNGVRFDDSSARVSDDDDDDNPGRSKDDLRLGMVVTVTGTSGTGTGSATATGTATAIVFGSELQGPVQSINGSTASGTVTTTPTVIATGTGTGTATGTTTSTTTASIGTQTLTILGQTVVAGTRTIYDPTDLPNGFASIRIGNILEVHGYLDPATNKLMATRIERKNNANSYKITGNVSSLKAASKTFKIGSENISYDGINPNRLNANLVDGLTVRVRLSTTQTTTGTWNATRIKAAHQVLANRNKVEIEGLITAFTSATKFSVKGVPVDASNASFPKGTASIALGARVEVKGSIVNGVLIASRVKIESDDDNSSASGGNSGSGGGDDNNVSSRNEIELHGAISSVNTTSKTFVLRGLTVIYAGNVDFQRGTATNLVNGAKVEVKGIAAANGTMVVAKKIKFED